jgi:hypothetical protein
MVEDLKEDEEERVWSCKDNNVEVTMVYVKNYLKRFVFNSSSL